MAVFEYKALDRRGTRKKGIIEADSVSQARDKLKKINLFPVSIESINENAIHKSSNKLLGLFGSESTTNNKIKTDSSSKNKASKYKLKAMELSLITRQLATLLQSGLTVEDSLKALIRQADSYAASAVMQQVLTSVTEGFSLADAMNRNSRSFPEIFVASVSAGEQTGKLGQVMDKLADYTEKREALKRNISGALIYPVMLIVVSILILIFLLSVIVPKIVGVFNDTGQTLPIVTRIIISCSEFLQNYGIYLFAGLALICWLLYLYFKAPEAKLKLHGWLLNLPGLKRTVRGLNAARMSRTLSIMVGSGVPLLTSMKSSKDVVSNMVIRNAFEKAAIEVSEGSSLGRSLERAQVFPPMLVQMVQSGEMSGRLPSMLERAANITEQELESRISSLVKVFEPMMILFMGGLVMVIVIAILLPIFQLNDIVG